MSQNSTTDFGLIGIPKDADRTIARFDDEARLSSAQVAARDVIATAVVVMSDNSLIAIVAETDPNLGWVADLLVETAVIELNCRLEERKNPTPAA